MCGFCGILNFDKGRPLDKAVLKKMTDVITHRGPDDDGFYQDDQINLGFRRLSIIDLEAGHQPMTNETGDIWIAYNGEFYNHDDIRKELLAKGHVYKTRCDTETIIHLYEEEGLNGLQKMVGMFGFALWDKPRNRLVLVRDRLGIKPVYYTETDRSLVFGSEIKSLLEYDKVPRQVNDKVIAEQLIFRYLAGEDTLFKGIKKLLPGHYLIWENGSYRTVKYWDVEAPEEFSEIKFETAMEQLVELLRDSVQKRLMSDVPLGTFCSGGVDSGLTTAYAKESHTGELNTFSVGFHEPAWDESPYARMVSDRFQTRHHVIKIDKKIYAESLPKLTWFHDEPLYHPSSPLVYHVSTLARKHVTVVLTGEGADELFGGYPRFLIPREYARLGFLPPFARRSLGGLINLLPHRKLNKLGHFLARPISEVALYNSQYALPDQVRTVLPGYDDHSQQYRLSLIDVPSLSTNNLLARTMRLDLKTYIPAALHRQDKMSMAVSLESRVPFLDHRLVEWAMQVPPDLKIKGTKNKFLLKQLGEKLLPREAIYRQKVGFGVPVVDWLRDREGLGRYLPLFEGTEYEKRDYIDSKAVKKIIAEHLNGSKNHCEILWNLINLELWHRIYINKVDFSTLHQL